MKIVQSMISLLGHYNAGIYEQRIVMLIARHASSLMLHAKVGDNSLAQEYQHDNVLVTMQAREILGDGSKHYEYVQSALKKLERCIYEYLDTRANTWYSSPLIYNVKYERGTGQCEFWISGKVWFAFLDLTKGFTRYDLVNALSLTSKGGARLYAIMASQTHPIDLTIDYLRNLFGAQKKYKQTMDFVKRVIQPAADEMESRKINGFTYRPIKEGNKVIALRMTPIKREVKQREEFLPKLSLSSIVPMGLLDYLRLTCGYSHRELAANKLTLTDFATSPSWEEDIRNIWARARLKNNPKAYAMGAMKREAALQRAAEQHN